MFKIGIYVFFFIATALIVLFGIKIRKEKKNELLDKEESNYIKGVAALMVFLAHTQDFLASNGLNDRMLYPFSFLGGIGVLLFFFLSGYGIYRGYANSIPTFKYWKNRITKVIIPACSISLISCLFIMLIREGRFSFLQWIKEAIICQWYIDILLVEYAIFFISWLIARKNKIVLLVISALFNILLGTILYFAGFEARWYNGMMLFPVGMFFAYVESKKVFDSRIIRIITMMMSFVMFMMTGIAFLKLKGLIMGDILKSVFGLCFAVFIVMTISFIVVGNKVIKWIGERSLYIYLCQGYILLLISALLSKGLIKISPEVLFYIMLTGTLLYAEVTYLLFSKGSKKLISNIGTKRGTDNVDNG